MKIIIGYLYSDLMNIYGDTGNIIAMQKRLQWRGIDAEIKHISVGEKLKKGDVDIFFFGGGQDQSQEIVAEDLIKSGKGKVIKSEAERGVPLLSICGGYQLLGEYYQPHEGQRLPGVGLFPVYTVAGKKRMIGNIIIKLTDILTNRSTDQLVVGFENHSGKSYLENGATPLGKVIKGFGNNGDDYTEGCIYKNSIGCYMHGSLLPKNPNLADWLITQALKIKYHKDIVLDTLDDSIEKKAHSKIISKLS